ncbi:MAG: hypothetical protein KIT17_23020 [Rubrivivax sp.]|nr:hypothetical protein [Rubrivivax sp.]
MTTEPVPRPEDDEALAHRLRASRQLEDAPEPVIQRALGLWRQAMPAPAAAPAAAPRRLTAVLRLDSAAASPLAFGLRSAEGGTRQLLYFSEGRDIDVRVMPLDTPEGRRWRITGQVLGPDASGLAELRGADGTRSTAWSELAEFGFDDVGAGRITIVLRSTEWELELPPIDLAA